MRSDILVHPTYVHTVGTVRRFFGLNGNSGTRIVAISKTNLPGKEIGFKITLEVYCKTLEVFYNALNCVLQYLIKNVFVHVFYSTKIFNCIAEHSEYSRIH